MARQKLYGEDDITTKVVIPRNVRETIERIARENDRSFTGELRRMIIKHYQPSVEAEAA